MDPNQTPLEGAEMTHEPQAINQMMMRQQDMSGFVQNGNQQLPPDPNAMDQMMAQQHLQQQQMAMAAAVQAQQANGGMFGAKTSTMTSLIGEFKGALIAAAVFILISMGFVDGFMGKQIPGFFGDDGISMIGIASKAALGGILFYLLNRFFK